MIGGAQPVARVGEKARVIQGSGMTSSEELQDEPTLEVNASEIFGARAGMGVEPTIDLIGVDEQVQENIPTAQLPEGARGDQPIGQDDRTLDVDGDSLAAPLRSETVVRLRTPHPKKIRDGARQGGRVTCAR